MLFGAIKSYLIETIVKTAIAAGGLVEPGGEIVEAVMDIYKVVMFFIEKANQILTLVETIVRSVSRIAHGDIGGRRRGGASHGQHHPDHDRVPGRPVGAGRPAEQDQGVHRGGAGAVDHAIEQALGG
jgi:hypothetical protein